MTAAELFHKASSFNANPHFKTALKDCEEAASKGDYYTHVSIPQGQEHVLSDLKDYGFQVGEPVAIMKYWNVVVSWRKPLVSRREVDEAKSEA